MARSIKLDWAISSYVTAREDAIRVRVDVTCASGLPAAVFAYRMLPDDPYGAESGHFSHICSPVDLEEYPESAPRTNDSPQWFRLSWVDVLVRSATEAENLVAVIREDLQRLLDSLAATDTLEAASTEYLGGEACQPSVSASVGSSGFGSSSASYGMVRTAAAFGTFEYSAGAGVVWQDNDEGAGSPLQSLSSADTGYSFVTLQPGEASSLLLIRGFDFSALPEDALVTGLAVTLGIRDSTGAVGSSSSAGQTIPAECRELSVLHLQHPTYGVGQNRGSQLCIPDAASGFYSVQSGGDGDLWGFASLPAAVLQDGAFSVGVAVSNISGQAATVFVDGAQLTVFWRRLEG